MGPWVHKIKKKTSSNVSITQFENKTGPPLTAPASLVLLVLKHNRGNAHHLNLND
jgi:hypothetical protein